MLCKNLVFKDLGLQDYCETLKLMQDFTGSRTPETNDELWITEHPSVFTLGRHADPEHLLLKPSECPIPIVYTDRGGEITYHGPGQLIIYFLLDLKRKKIGPKHLVCLIEQAVINLLDKNFNIKARRQSGAPGIYVSNSKIASLGLKITRGFSYHGLSLNIDLDLCFFKLINPCGYKDLAVTQLIDLITSARLCPLSSPVGLDSTQGGKQDLVSPTLPTMPTMTELGIVLAQEFSLLWESGSSKSSAC